MDSNYIVDALNFRKFLKEAPETGPAPFEVSRSAYDIHALIVQKLRDDKCPLSAEHRTRDLKKSTCSLSMQFN